MNPASLYSTDEPSEAFLGLVPVNFRGSFKNFCLMNGPRVGVTDPAQIAAAVRAILARRSDAAAVDMVTAMDAHPEDLRAFLLSILDHDRQPAEVRQQRKAMARTEAIGRYMDALQPTQKQRNLLAGLGYTGVVHTRFEACQTIEHLLSEAKRKARDTRR